ncbi:citrate lyase holo-[acyl-carrier protein] synthase [Clostridiaceae bacterium 35-E11]
MIDKILMDREKRYHQILSLLEKYHLPVICGKINYPGKHKTTHEAQIAFRVLTQSIQERYATASVFRQVLDGYDGSSMLMVVDMDPVAAKNIAVDMEEHHFLGRIFDIDVYIEDGSSIGREKFKKGARRCVLCSEDARICMRMNRHSMESVIQEINRLIHEYESLC